MGDGGRRARLAPIVTRPTPAGQGSARAPKRRRRRGRPWRLLRRGGRTESRRGGSIGHLAWPTL
eukprot:5364754-Alexandrium_andersonii.AAC.1